MMAGTNLKAWGLYIPWPLTLGRFTPHSPPRLLSPQRLHQSSVISDEPPRDFFAAGDFPTPNCNLDEGNLSSLEQEGRIAAKEISRWRVDPGAAMPTPSDGEIMMLKSHID
jgi:hypothetical protein